MSPKKNGGSQKDIVKHYSRKTPASYIRKVETMWHTIQSFKKRTERAKLTPEDSWVCFQEVADQVVMRGGANAENCISTTLEGRLAEWAHRILPRVVGVQGNSDLSTICHSQYVSLNWVNPGETRYIQELQDIISMWELAKMEDHTACSMPDSTTLRTKVISDWKIAAGKKGMDITAMHLAVLNANTKEWRDKADALTTAFKSWHTDNNLYGEAHDRRKPSPRKTQHDQRVCRFFTSPRGCHVKNCRYKHSNPRPVPTMVNAVDMKQTKGQCWGFQKEGSCRFGEQCRFSHRTEQKGTTNGKAERAVNSQPCWDWQAGNCRRTHCRFTHPEGPRGTPTSQRDTSAQVCSWFNGAGCQYGDRCNKNHVCGSCGGKGHTTSQHEKHFTAAVLIDGGPTQGSNDEQIIPMTRAYVGDREDGTQVDILAGWDSHCLGLDGQISTALAKLLRRKGLATIRKKRKTVNYGGLSNLQRTTDGICTLSIGVTDGEDDAKFTLSLHMLQDHMSSVLVGWNTISEHKIDLTSDTTHMIIPVPNGEDLRVEKISMGEWRHNENMKKKIAVVNAMIDPELRNEESIFDCSPTTSTN
jgi:hypothetical protein